MPSHLLIASLANSFIAFRQPLIHALLNARARVHVTAPDTTTNERVRDVLQSMGVILHDIPMFRTGMNPFRDIKSLLALRRLMREIQPTYVLSYGYAFMDEVHLAKRRLINFVARNLYRLSLCSAEKVFFQNSENRQLFLKTGALSQSTSSTVFNSSKMNHPQTPFPPSHIRFLLIANLIADKGIREYAQAAAIIKQKHPEVAFDLVGRLDTVITPY